MKVENIKEEDEFPNKELTVQITAEKSCTAYVTDPCTAYVPEPFEPYEPELQVKLEDYDVKGNLKLEQSEEAIKPEFQHPNPAFSIKYCDLNLYLPELPKSKNNN